MNTRKSELIGLKQEIQGHWDEVYDLMEKAKEIGVPFDDEASVPEVLDDIYSEIVNELGRIERSE